MNSATYQQSMARLNTIHPGSRGHLGVKKGDGHRYDQHTHDQQYQADKVPIEPERQWYDKALYYDNS